MTNDQVRAQGCGTKLGDLIRRKEQEWGEKFDASDLNPNFVRAFNLGPRHRVRVLFPSGEVVWGFIGITTGWKPAFLLMRRLGQHGSSLLLGENCKQIDWKDL